MKYLPMPLLAEPIVFPPSRERLPSGNMWTHPPRFSLEMAKSIPCNKKWNEPHALSCRNKQKNSFLRHNQFRRQNSSIIIELNTDRKQKRWGFNKQKLGTTKQPPSRFSLDIGRSPSFQNYIHLPTQPVTLTTTRKPQCFLWNNSFALS